MNFIHSGVTSIDHGAPTFYVIDWHKDYMVPVDIQVYSIDFDDG
jgi:hypothetical protein